MSLNNSSFNNNNESRISSSENNNEEIDSEKYSINFNSEKDNNNNTEKYSINSNNEKEFNISSDSENSDNFNFNLNYKNDFKLKQTNNNDLINKLYNDLNNEGLIEKKILNIYDNKKNIVGKRIIKYNNKNYQNNWIKVYHGTKYKNLVSIFKEGLKKTGEIINGNEKVNVRKGHIQYGKKVNNEKNWANAIFVSPSIFYSSHSTYSERINLNGKKWCVLVEAKIKPNSCQAYDSTIKNYNFKKDEPKKVEYRITEMKNIFVCSVLFVEEMFLKNANNYKCGDIFC